MSVCPETILQFWFDEIEPKAWWVKDATFDQTVKQRFEPILTQAKRGSFITGAPVPGDV